MKTPKLPKVIYVRYGQDGDNWFLIAGANAGEISESESTINAGKYVLES